MADDKIHPGVINFHEAAVEAITLTHEGGLSRRDLQWLRADANAVLTSAQRLLDAMEEAHDAR